MKNKSKIISLIIFALIIALTSCNAKKNASDNWDKVIADYEKFVDDYAITIQRAVAGDESAFEHFHELDMRLDYWIEQLTVISNAQLSPEQEEKLDEITGKLARTVLGVEQ